jgi:hypothetical protein
LEDCYNPSARTKYPFYIPNIENCPAEKPKYNTSEILLALGKLCVQVLNGCHKISFDYSHRAQALGYSQGAKMNQILIEKDFNHFYSEKFFSKKEYSPLLFIKHKITNPYRHIMLDYFLSSKMQKTGIVAKTIKLPFWDKYLFGSGPWPCINPLCKEFGKNLIANPDFKYDSKSKRTVGLFYCSCGTTYTKSFAVKDGIIIKTNLKIRKKTVRGIKLKDSKDISKNELSALQEEWIQLKSELSLTNNDKRKLYALTTRLNRINRDWVSDQKIKIKNFKDAETKNKKIKIINEQKLLVSSIIESFREDPPPFRITQSQILRKSNLTKSKIEPLIRKFITKHEESITDYQIRRLRKAAQELTEKNEKLTPSKLLFNAHIWKKDRRVIKEAKKICS